MEKFKAICSMLFALTFVGVHAQQLSQPKELAFCSWHSPHIGMIRPLTESVFVDLMMSRLAEDGLYDPSMTTKQWIEIMILRFKSQNTQTSIYSNNGDFFYASLKYWRKQQKTVNTGNKNADDRGAHGTLTN